MIFKKVVIEDRELIQKYIENANVMGCEFCFANMLLWSDFYEAEFAHVNNTLVFKVKSDDKMRFSFPLGEIENIALTIQQIMDYCALEKVDFEFKGITPQNKEVLEKIFPETFDYIEDRDSYDYIYNIEDLINLKGKKYHAKRNHVNRFKKENNFTYEQMTKENAKDCLAMLEEWHALNIDEDSDDSKKAEIIVVNNMCKMLDKLHLIGGLIKIDSKVVAFTIGEQLSKDTFVVHIEKAFSDINGCYTVINQQFCEKSINSYRYINREEDLGIEGLRKSKLSYYPEILLQKDIARKR